MPSTRRRFLAGVTALTGGLAGCNGTALRDVDETVTPVEVPRTDREILREAAGIEVPSLPPTVVVSEAHLESAIDQVDRLRRSVLEAMEAREEPVGDEGPFNLGDSPEETVERAEERIARAREMGASPQALDTLRGALHDAATAVGYLRADAGDLTMADVEDALEAERAGIDDLRDGMEYRVAAPVAAYLPTVHAAEEVLRRYGGSGRRVHPAAEDGVARSEPRPPPTPEPDPEDVGDRYYLLERTRRHRDDVEHYLETATGDGAPSIRSALETALADVRAALEPIAEEYRGADGSSDGESFAAALESFRRNVGNDAAYYLSSTTPAPPDGDLVRVLFRGVERLVSFRSVDAGVERTLERLDGGRVPAETLLPEKRRAVQNLEGAADAPPLHRTFSRMAVRILRTAAEAERKESVSVEDVARAHYRYVTAAERAERGPAIGEGLTDSLQAQQS